MGQRDRDHKVVGFTTIYVTTLGTQNTGRRQTKQKKQHRKIKR